MLDVNTNMSLGTLDCRSNQLSTLDLSTNTRLYKLICHDNQLSTLNLSTNTKIRELWCGYNKSAALVLNPNIKLWLLSCENNFLPLSDLFAASEILKNSEAKIYNKFLGNQTLPAQTITLGTTLEFPVLQNVFNSIYTKYLP